MKRDECYLCVCIEADLHRAVTRQERRRDRMLPVDLAEIETLKADRAEHQRLAHE